MNRLRCLFETPTEILHLTKAHRKKIEVKQTLESRYLHAEVKERKKKLSLNSVDTLSVLIKL